MGIVIYLFFIWRRLKEDYLAEKIFTLSLFEICGIALGYLISKRFHPVWFFWFEGFGAFLGFSLGIIKYEMKFIETFEASFIAIMPWISIFFLKDYISAHSVFSLIFSALSFSLIIIFYYLDARYKNITWYKSGRIGFAGLTIAGIFFLLRASAATLFPYVLSFVGKSEIILSGVCAFVIFLLVYNLAREEK